MTNIIGVGIVGYHAFRTNGIDPMTGVNLVRQDVDKIQAGDWKNISLTGQILAASVAGIGGMSLRKLQRPLTLGALAIGQPMFAAGTMVGGDIGGHNGGRRRSRRRSRRRGRSRRR